jgi:hypothetical protein
MSQFPPLPEPVPEPLMEPFATTETFTNASDIASDTALDDVKLLVFLQAHQPSVPAVAADLEDRVMAAIAAAPVPTSARRHLKRRTLRPKMLLGAVAGAVLAGAGGIWAKQIWQPVPQPALQMAQLEQFLETSWDVTGTDFDHPYATSIPDSTDSGEIFHLEF